MATSGNISLFELVDEETRKNVERLLVHITGPDAAAWKAGLACLLECKPVLPSKEPQASVSPCQDPTTPV